MMKRARNTNWTDEQIAEVERLLLTGLTYDQVGAAVGSTGASINQLVGRGRVKVRSIAKPLIGKPRHPEKVAKLCELVRGGMMIKRAAQEAGISPASAHAIIKRENITSAHAQYVYSAEDDATILRMFGEGATDAEIALEVRGDPAFAMSISKRRRGALKVTRPRAVWKPCLVPVKRVAPSGKTKVEMIRMDGVINGQLLAGWHTIFAWWKEHGGKGWPQIGAVNELRRKHKRLPFLPMAGTLAHGPRLFTGAPGRVA